MHLHASLSISMHLYASLCISMHLYASPCISIHLHASLCISMHLYPPPARPFCTCPPASRGQRLAHRPPLPPPAPPGGCLGRGRAADDGARAPPFPSPPSRTNWTRLVPSPVLTGHVSSLPPGAADAGARAGRGRSATSTRSAPQSSWRARSPSPRRAFPCLPAPRHAPSPRGVGTARFTEALCAVQKHCALYRGCRASSCAPRACFCAC
jgi:hypothetical protein